MEARRGQLALRLHRMELRIGPAEASRLQLVESTKGSTHNARARALLVRRRGEGAGEATMVTTTVWESQAIERIDARDFDLARLKQRTPAIVVGALDRLESARHLDT